MVHTLCCVAGCGTATHATRCGSESIIDSTQTSTVSTRVIVSETSPVDARLRGTRRKLLTPRHRWPLIAGWEDPPRAVLVVEEENFKRPARM